MESGATKIAILGAAGQLGQELAALLPDAVGLTRQIVDLARPESLSVLREHRPAIVFNCAAYNLVDQAEAEPEAAFAVNALGVRKLAEVCRDLDGVLVHFSTNFVFGLDGFRPEPYRESDAPGPLSVYGVSKLAGEYFARQTCPKHFVIRTSGLYGSKGQGGKGTNFVKTMLRLAGEGKPIRVVDDQILTPTAAADLAEATLRLIEHCPYGLYHLTNGGQCSWFEFAQAIFEISGVKADVSPCSSAERPTPARRPEYSVLTSEHAAAPKPRSWQDALRAYLDRTRR